MPGGPRVLQNPERWSNHLWCVRFAPLRHLYLVLSDGITGLKRGFVSGKWRFSNSPPTILSQSLSIRFNSETICEMRLYHRNHMPSVSVLTFKWPLHPTSPDPLIHVCNILCKSSEVDKNMKDDNKTRSCLLLIITMNSLNSSKRRSPHRLLKIIFSGCILLLVVPVKALNIAHTSDASTVEQQAAKEVRRYVFLRTGIAPEVISANRYADLPGGDVIVVAADNQSIITELKPEYGM